MPEPPHQPGKSLAGAVVSAGVARGPAFVCGCTREPIVARRTITAAQLPEEIARWQRAVAAVEAKFGGLRDHFSSTDHGGPGQILASDAALLRDPMLHDATLDRCRHDLVNIDAALDDVTRDLADSFARIRDPMIRGRLADIRDVARHLLGELAGPDSDENETPPEGCILVTRELLPSVAAALDRQRVRGVVTEEGATTAHAVILARALAIPTVIQVGEALRNIAPGDRIIVDGVAGRVFVNPPPAVEREYDQLAAALADHQRQLQEIISLPAITRDGAVIGLHANIGLVADAALAANAGCEGVGLYRTEFVFFAQDHLPSEDEQYTYYRRAADCLGGRPLVVRALDLGSDKLLPYFPQPRELNPSLGRRGTRLLLAEHGLLLDQLRAILRLSATCPVALLFPMIGSVDEIRAAKQIVQRAKDQLVARGVAFDANVRIGAMIETPAAAILVGPIAREVDFLCIGTNDLVQYLLAIDRTSRDLAADYEPLHPAVLRTLKGILDTAASHGCEVSICGEIAGNPAFTALLLGLGARIFSVAPTELLEIKRRIRDTHLAAATALAARALQASTIAETRALLASAGPGGGPGLS